MSDKASVQDIMQTMEYGPAPESAAPALEWLAQFDGKLPMFIGGKWVQPHPAKHFESVNPATGKPLARIAQGSKADVDTAVKAARKAQAAWWKIGGHARARYLYAIARQIQKHSRLLAVLETLDNGKSIRESRDIDVPTVARHFYHHAGWAQLMESEYPGCTPLGVIGQVIPWNFPLLMLSWKIAPALAAGNTVVLKPAEFTSVTAIKFAEICMEVGLPTGVVNIVTGDGKTGAAIVEHPDVDKIAFTGSTDVGRIIRRATAGSGKKLSLELGGKSPFIVFEDADLDSVVEGAVDAIWFNQGQVCCAGSRLLVQEGVAERLYEKLKSRMQKLKLGDPLDKGVDVGAIVAPVQLERIQELVAQGQKEGAKMWQPTWAAPRDGYFYPPTLFTDVAPSSTIAQVEIFGPVLAAMTFRTPAEAVKLANNTRYGLAASVWSESINLALDIAPQLKAGTVWINCTNLFDAAAGFGGYRESGYGREGGREGMLEYMQLPPAPTLKPKAPKKAAKAAAGNGSAHAEPPINQTAKLYIGGKQKRPDSGYSRMIHDAKGKLLGEVGEGNRKDIRDAVEAASEQCLAWSRTASHARAQIIYYIAENLGARGGEFATRLQHLTGCTAAEAKREVEASIRCLFDWAAWCDKYDGAVHHTPFRNVTLAMPEPMGVIGIVCDRWQPLLGLISLAAPAVARGNCVVAVPSEIYPLMATDFYQVLETSDLPGGVINIVTGGAEALAEVLAGHDDVAAVWYFGSAQGSAQVERLSAENMKRTWVNNGVARDWLRSSTTLAAELHFHATQVKNIWIPYGE